MPGGRQNSEGAAAAAGRRDKVIVAGKSYANTFSDGWGGVGGWWVGGGSFVDLLNVFLFAHTE